MRWNGSDRTTTYVNSTQLTALIPSSDIASAGTAYVTVYNPTPGGGTSNQVAFTINASRSPFMSLKFNDNGALIVNGSVLPSTSNGTDFATNVSGGTVSHTFTIYNIGYADLNLTGTPKVAFSGTNAADFTVNPQPTARFPGHPAQQPSL